MRLGSSYGKTFSGARFASQLHAPGGRGLGGLWDQETIPRSKDPYYGKLIRGLMGFSKPHKVGNPTKAKLCWVLVLSLHNKEPYYLL